MRVILDLKRKNYGSVDSRLLVRLLTVTSRENFSDIFGADIARTPLRRWDYLGHSSRPVLIVHVMTNMAVSFKLVLFCSLLKPAWTDAPSLLSPLKRLRQRPRLSLSEHRTLEKMYDTRSAAIYYSNLSPSAVAESREMCEISIEMSNSIKSQVLSSIQESTVTEYQLIHLM